MEKANFNIVIYSVELQLWKDKCPVSLLPFPAKHAQERQHQKQTKPKRQTKKLLVDIKFPIITTYRFNN